MRDLFEDNLRQPKELKAIVDKWLNKMDLEGLEYTECETFLNEVKAVGYTFEYGLDAEPFNLRKIPPMLNIDDFRNAKEITEETYSDNYEGIENITNIC